VTSSQTKTQKAAADTAIAADLTLQAAADITRSNQLLRARAAVPVRCAGLQGNLTLIYMSDTQNPDPKKKDVRDLTPDKDAKGGGHGHSGGLNTPGRGKHHQK
jgi:hypothetical protein